MTREEFKEGAAVRVARLNRTGLIETRLADDRYRVCVGSLRITCSSGELTPAQKPKELPTTRATIAPVEATTRPSREIDLHGKTVDEAIRLLDQWIDSALLHGLSDLRIVHGLGTGRVQAAVHTYLSSLTAVSHFRLNDRNPGETLVYL
jgi:DNA mismatch repair protein MutS2